MIKPGIGKDGNKSALIYTYVTYATVIRRSQLVLAEDANRNVTPHAPGYTSPQSHTAHGRAADA